MLVKIRFSEGLSDFTDTEKTALRNLNLEKENDSDLIKYRFKTDDITQVFTIISSLGYKNKLILGKSKREEKFCIMELSK